MRNYNTTFREIPRLSVKTDKWIRGLNTTVSATEIRPDELSEAQDIQLVEDGKVQCPRDGQAYFGNTSGSRVTGLFPYYKSDGTKQLLRMSGTALQKRNTTTNDWDTISGFTYTNNLNANGVMAYDRMYIVNGTDNLTYYDGSAITSFTSISAPSTPTATRTGSAGSYTFSYKISAVTSVGETTPSSAGSTTLNQATLDTSNYMTVTWSSVTSAIGYNVYGRKDGQWFFLKYVEGNTSTTYIDKGQDTPQETFTPQESNTTAGPEGKYIELYKDSLFVFGDPSNPSRLYYSGGGDKVHDFSVGSGGGFIDISKNDGQLGTGIKVFKNALLVFKEDSCYQFSFTTAGLPQISQINPAIGCIAPRSIVAVENDVFFASRRGIFSIGNEAGFSFDVLRTNEISARARSVYANIDPAYIQNIAAIYTTDASKNLVIFAYTPAGSTTNSKALVYDRERLGWYKWSNIQANCWAAYRGTDGQTHFIYGDDSSGYVKEILTGSDDFGSAIRGYFAIKSEDFDKDGGLNRYKTLKDIDIVLRRPQGYLSLSVIVDGVTTAYDTPIGTVSPSTNFGHYTFTDFLFGDSIGSGVSSADEIKLSTIKNVNIEGKAFQLYFDNNGVSSFTLLLTALTAKAKSARYRQSGDVVN